MPGVLRQLFRWQAGRQGSGYEKMLLATAPLPVPFDVYLLRYRVGSSIDYHTDPAPAGKRHYRANLFLKHAVRGGAFLVEGGHVLLDHPRLQIFRPDLTRHAVSRIEEGERLVLSIGWLLRA